jgi:HSP20 family molecular chaperone IbpA
MDSYSESKQRALSAPVMPSLGALDLFSPDVIDSGVEQALTNQMKLLVKNASAAIPRLLVDIVEFTGGLEVRIDLAGVKKEDVALQIDAHHVFVSADKRVERDSEGADSLVHKLESFSGFAQRTIKVGGKFGKWLRDEGFQGNWLTLSPAPLPPP